MMGLPHVLRLFICLSVGPLFVCTFLYVVRTRFYMKLVLFTTLCLRNVYHSLWYVPNNVWQIKPENFLILHSWILVAPLFIEFKYRQWESTTQIPKTVVRIQNQDCFFGKNLLMFIMFCRFFVWSSINGRNS